MFSTKAMTTEWGLQLLNHAFRLCRDNSVSNRRSNCPLWAGFSIARPSSTAGYEELVGMWERQDVMTRHPLTPVSSVEVNAAGAPSVCTSGGGLGIYDLQVQLAEMHEYGRTPRPGRRSDGR